MLMGPRAPSPLRSLPLAICGADLVPLPFTARSASCFPAQPEIAREKSSVQYRKRLMCRVRSIWRCPRNQTGKVNR